MAQFTLTFFDSTDDKSGWTSFWDYYPEHIFSLGNKFYSIFEGQLYEHYDNDNPIRNKIYDKNIISEITTIINEDNAEDKIFKTLVLESNDAWNVDIKTNYTNSSLAKTDFDKKESKYFAYIRKNEDENDFTDRVQGIGIIESVSLNKIVFTAEISSLVNVGEHLVQITDGQQLIIGIIQRINNKNIEVESIINTPITSSFCFSLKNARIQGSEIRGYFAEITLRNDSNKAVELYAINSNIILSNAATQQK